jgi:U3 small nucleolar ribonucleoprotein protein IMP4
LRREYLYRKSLEGKERDQYEKKRKIRKALAGKKLLLLFNKIEGKPIPTELREEEPQLRREIEMEDENTEGNTCRIFRLNMKSLGH